MVSLESIAFNFAWCRTILNILSPTDLAQKGSYSIFIPPNVRISTLISRHTLEPTDEKCHAKFSHSKQLLKNIHSMMKWKDIYSEHTVTVLHLQQAQRRPVKTPAHTFRQWRIQSASESQYDKRNKNINCIHNVNGDRWKLRNSKHRTSTSTRWHFAMLS